MSPVTKPPFDAALADIISLVPKLPDEEWDKRDAEIAANRERIATLAGGRPRLDLLGDLGFPRRAREAVADGINLAMPAIAKLRAAREWNILILSGPKGCGKTVAATWWASQRTDTVRFVRASTLAASSRYDRDQRSVWLGSALVLDDLGAEFVDTKGSFLADLDELVDTLYGDMHPLLITTNCDAKQFLERYGERIADRLRECGRWLSVSSESLRKRPDGAAP